MTWLKKSKKCFYFFLGLIDCSSGVRGTETGRISEDHPGAAVAAHAHIA